MAVDYFQMATDLARRKADEMRRPTEQDHRLAEHRGLSLCDRCGAELAFPGELYQLCGACEAHDNAAPAFCPVCEVEPVRGDGPTCGSRYCREGYELEARR